MRPRDRAAGPSVSFITFSLLVLRVDALACPAGGGCVLPRLLASVSAGCSVPPGSLWLVQMNRRGEGLAAVSGAPLFGLFFLLFSPGHIRGCGTGEEEALIFLGFEEGSSCQRPPEWF